MAPVCMTGCLRLCSRPLLFDLCLIFLIHLICSPSGNVLITYDRQTLLNLRSFHHYGPDPCWNIVDATSPRWIFPPAHTSCLYSSRTRNASGSGVNRVVFVYVLRLTLKCGPWLIYMLPWKSCNILPLPGTDSLLDRSPIDGSAPSDNRLTLPSLWPVCLSGPG